MDTSKKKSVSVIFSIEKILIIMQAMFFGKLHIFKINQDYRDFHRSHKGLGVSIQRNHSLGIRNGLNGGQPCNAFCPGTHCE